MTDALLAATRKGLFQLRRSGRTWRVAGKAFLGEPVSMVMHDPRDGRIYAALNLGHFGPKLHVSKDGGSKWKELPCPAFPKSDGPDAPSVLQIWALEPGGPKQKGRLWAGTIGGGLFRSDDGGQSWALVESLWNAPGREKWFGGGNDAPGIHSICIDPNDPDRLIVGVSCGGVWMSDDAGRSWACRADGMFAAYMPPEQRGEPNVQDPHRVVQCRAATDTLWAQHHNGIFRTTDRCRRWHEVTTAKPSSFGFAVAVHPGDPDRAWFVPAIKDEQRIPVDGAMVVTRTTDGGRTFRAMRKGLPQKNAYDLVYRHALAIDGEGEWLAMGSTSGHLWMSGDQGESWTLTEGHLPPVYALRFAEL
jgi:photosystem II stability/assembly factor-like uncharacterized protein